MRKAPRKEKGGHSRPGLIEIWQARDRLNLLPAQTKIEISGGRLTGLLLVPICRVSPHSSATVVAATAFSLLLLIENMMPSGFFLKKKPPYILSKGRM
jgi:hypothetical protein